MRIRPIIDLPNTPRLPAWGTGVMQFIERLKTVLLARDRKIAEAINSADVEIVDAAPSDAPDYPEPQIKLYKDATDGWRIYAWTGATDGWVYFNQEP